MCEIKKMIFTVSQADNPMALVWLDESDTTKQSDCVYFAIKSQVAFLFSKKVGDKIEIKTNNKGYKNVTVPDTYIELFDNYKVSPNPAVKMFGATINNMFDNCFASIAYLKNGETVHISQEEADEKCMDYMKGFLSLYNVATKSLKASPIESLKTIAKTVEKADSKPSEIKDAHAVIQQFASLLSREVIAKNNFVIDNPEVKDVTEESIEEKKKSTKSKSNTKKPKADEVEEEIPF